MKYTVGFTLASDKKMHSLNRKYRGINSSTDVLSFNLNEPLGKDEVWLGDVVVSFEEAKKQAKEKGISVEEAFGELVKHGARHLVGWSHE